MLLVLPAGKKIPVNYLCGGDTVHATTDFPWWRELRGTGGHASVLIRDETRRGRMRAVEGEPDLRASAGTLVVVDLTEAVLGPRP